MNMFKNSILLNKNVIKSPKFGEEIINLGAMTYRIPDYFNYHVVQVSPTHIARPDLISQTAYGTDQYGDLICKLNGISNPFELDEGMILVIPEIEYLDDFFLIDEFDDEVKKVTNENKPEPKKRNEKRKPNEAVMGDIRFKIDKTNKVIVY